MKKSNIIVLALSTLLVVCNALPMNNHVENKKEVGISQKEASKKKSKKDKRKTQQQRQEPEIKQEPPKIIPMEQPPKEVELPDDFGIVMEPEEPEPIELPDPNENNRNIFDEIFNSDSDNWDDSNI